MPSMAPRARVASAGPALMGGLLAGLAFALLSAAPTAEAATFRLVDGLRLEGSVTAVGRRYLTIETSAGSRLVSLAALSEVTVVLPDGKTVSGTLKDWRDGSYTLQTVAGLVVAKDRGPASGGGTDTAEAPRPRPAAAKPGRPEAKTPAEQSADVARSSAAASSGARAALSAEPALRQGAKKLQLPPLDSFGDLGGSDRVRGMLDGILSGDSDEVAALALEPAAAPPPEQAPAALESAPPPNSAVPPPQNAPSEAAERPTAALLEQRPLETDLRAPALDYRDGVLGGGGVDAQRARSCARLSRLVGPPLASESAAGLKRADRRSLLIAIGGDYASEAVASLAASFFKRSGVETGEAKAGDDAALAIRVEGKQPRLSLPYDVAALRYEAPGDALQGAEEGRADVVLSPNPGGVGAGQGHLVAFDAVAVVAHPKNPLRRLTRRDLASLLSGAVTDWSMIQTDIIGAPTLYLPPQRSVELDILSNLARVRRIKPQSVQYIADPRTRLWAALTDPMGLAVAPRSSLGDAPPLAVGRSDTGVLPTRDTIRNAVYPMITPVYVSIPEAPLNPAAPGFAAFLSSPEGQRALFDAGLTPVAACDPSTCALHAEGLDEARARIKTPKNLPALSKVGADRIPLAAASAPLARFDFPASRERTPPALVDRIAGAIASLARRDDADQPLIVAARAGLPGSEAGADRTRLGAERAEATALALRCAGFDVRSFGVDASAHSGSAEAPVGAIPVEVLRDQ